MSCGSSVPHLCIDGFFYFIKDGTDTSCTLGHLSHPAEALAQKVPGSWENLTTGSVIGLNSTP